MRVTMTSAAARTGRVNEDFTGAVPTAAVLIDGAGISGTESICRHGVAWYASRLGGSLLSLYESMHTRNWPTPSEIPTGVAVFADDIAVRRHPERGNTIVHWSEFDRGGHFAAMEAPDLLVQDVRTFF